MSVTPSQLTHTASRLTHQPSASAPRSQLGTRLHTLPRNADTHTHTHTVNSRTTASYRTLQSSPVIKTFSFNSLDIPDFMMYMTEQRASQWCHTGDSHLHFYTIHTPLWSDVTARISSLSALDPNSLLIRRLFKADQNLHSDYISSTSTFHLS